MLYVFDEIDKLTDDFLQQCSQHLSSERRRKALSYRFSLDQKLSAAAYLLLRLALKEGYGINEPVAFSYGKNGKPYLREYPQIYFSLSHCRNAAACAVSNDEVGVDVQEVIPVSDDLARRVLTAKEYTAFQSSKDPSLLFCRYWVIKESYLKRSGDGIGMDLTALSSDSISVAKIFQRGKDYCGCVVGACGSTKQVIKPEFLF